MRPIAVELTDDPAFARRVFRLAATSAIALGFVWYLAGETVEADRMVEWGLLSGWILMPSVLLLSLRRPRLRYATVVPSVLVSLSLLAICATALPDGAALRTGWLMITGGVLMGALLGTWFWFRWIPVPTGLSDPFSRGRWALISVHVAIIVGGLILVAISTAT